MYQVSQNYINALKAPAKVRRLTGTIGSISFTDNNIAQGSFQIDNKCAGDSDIKLGSVYVGELTCLFTGINLAIGQWMGQTITVSEGLLTKVDGVDAWEDVPLGVYTVTEANWQENGVFVTAYDNMTLLDKDFAISTTSGKPYDYLTLIARDTGIVLAQTEEQIGALPNGSRAYALYSENDIQTYRDLLFWVAQTCACFATIDRTGKLVLRKYGGDSVYTIGQNERWTGSQFSDYTTLYTKVTVEQIEAQSVESAGVDAGVTYSLGANPLMQGISTTASLQEILVALQSVQYTPFNVARSGCPAYDLGDAVTFDGGVGDGLVGCIMSYDYTFRGEYQITGLGSNPKMMNAKSKTDKELSFVMSRTNANEVQFYTYTNAQQIEIHDDYKQIIYVRFGSTKSTIVTFHAEVKLNAEAEVTDDVYNDIIGSIKYIFNQEELSYHPVETWMDGDHLLHLLYYIPIQGSAINTFSVRMKCDGGTITIDQGDIQCAVSGQGLVATTTWDGYIELEDNVTAIQIRTSISSIGYIDDELTFNTHVPAKVEIEEYVGAIPIRTAPQRIAPIYDSLYLNKRRLSDYTWGQVLNQVIPALQEYNESATYSNGDLVFTEIDSVRTEYRCICGDGETTTGAFDDTKWEIRTYNTWGDLFRLCAW